MKTFPVLVAGLLPLAAAAAPQAASGVSPTTAPMVVKTATRIAWGEAPAALPKGAQTAVLAGDPGAAGPFTLRLKVPAGYTVPMHWHPRDEQVTVIQGDVTFRSDDGAAAHRLDPGDFALTPAKMHHSASSQGGAIVQISAMGPFEITYVNAKDDPRQPQATP